MQAELDAAEAEKEKVVETNDAPADKAKAKKGKLVAKSTGLTYQFQIMESIGIPRAEIKKFADPQHWLKIFPPIAIVRRLSLLFPFNINLLTGRQQLFWIPYRLAPHLHDNRSEPIL